MLDVRAHGATVLSRGTEEAGTSLRGNGVTTKTCSVSARPAVGSVAAKVGVVDGGFFFATPGLYGCDARHKGRLLHSQNA
jgi:hypothetical protein